ncbi:response regulator [Paenibacillus sp. sgz302251]|uniref:response regulator transcription factor n=1 Tax=Paenibacillus sp. sgz302251 TaxID=3414493 RepID=UPI003C7B7528
MAGMLIVDDEAESRQDIRLIVEESPYSYLSVYEAGTAERGLLLLRQNQPDIVFLDLSLPDMDGIELGKKMLETSPRVSIVVVTHLKMFETVQKSMNAGFSSYFLKPFTNSDLLQSLDRLMLPSLRNETLHVHKAVLSANPVEMDPGKPIQSVTDYIHSHFYEPITLNEVADWVYLSASHFSRLFKTEMGVTFVEYLTKYRVEQSKRLIKMTSMPIEVIANHTGFANAGYFATTFKRLEGITPTEYRNLFSNFINK